MKSRFRVFAGPNGSGKSSLFEYLRSTRYIHTEIYVSADRIEAELVKKEKFVFNAYRVKTSEEDFFKYIENSSLWLYIKAESPDKLFSLKGGILKVKKRAVNSYSASFIAGYLVEKLLNSGQSFCFETVMSHESKLDLFERAQNAGYKTYLYYVYTSNVELNIARIKIRVMSGGHDVPDDKVRERFGRSLGLLSLAVDKSDIAFILDNTFNDFKIVGVKDNIELKWENKELPEYFKSFEWFKKQ
ncbi:MAG: hypothetical protein WDA74_06330 [Spirochaetota bacterium]